MSCFLRACALAFCLAFASSKAAQLPAEELLSTDTIVLLTFRDWSDTTNGFWQSSLGRFWQDPAMRAAREKFNIRFTNEVSAGLEKELGIKLSEYADLLSGQLTLAVNRPVDPGASMGYLLIADAKNKTDLLKIRLEELRKKWTAAGRQFKVEKIRGVEFTSYQFTQAALQKVMRSAAGMKPDAIEPDPEAEKTKIGLLVGQSQTLLVVGTQLRDVEKVLARQDGGTFPALWDQPVFMANYNAVFRDADAFLWVDFKPIFEQMIKPSDEPKTAAAQLGGLANLNVQRVLPALGLGELKSIAAKLSFKPEGIEGQLFLTVPEQARRGLLKILAPPAKDASPPPFVPGDAVKFQRVRIDFPQAWSVLESVMVKIDPSVAGLVQLMLGAAGKDKDPDFDLKKSLIESLGDDYISFEKAPKGSNEPPALKLFGARNPEQLLNAVRVLMRMAPEPIGTALAQEREFLGRKILTLVIAPGAPRGSMHFAPAAGYLAYSTDAAILEDFLRGGERAPKSLRDLPGFAEAAQKAGGQNTGWYSFENQLATMRAQFEAMKDKSDLPPSGFTLNPFRDELERLKDWIDGPSLPPFDRVSKYFYYYVTTGAATPEGINFKLSAPTPPTIK